MKSACGRSWRRKGCFSFRSGNALDFPGRASRFRANGVPAGGSSRSSIRSWPLFSRPECRSCSRSTSSGSGTDQPVLKRVLDDVHEQVRGGTSLSDAFASHGDLFPGVYTASILAGEKSGNLEETLRRYVSYANVISGVRRRTLSALIYPAILLALSGIVVAIILVRVVPEFTSFYDSMGATLPLATRLLTRVSLAVTEFFWLILLAAAAAAGAIWAWGRQPGRGAQIDRLLLSLPFVGSVAIRFSTSQLARTLATLLGGGIPLVKRPRRHRALGRQPLRLAAPRVHRARST